MPAGTSVTFSYDPFGRRIKKGSSVYLYDGANLIQESDSLGNLVARYVQGPGIDQPLVAYRGSTTEFYEADGLGSVTSLTTTAGTVNQTYVFDSFGQTTSTTGTFTQPFRYTGREFDSETGLYYYRARYYDSASGRFLNEDALRFTAGVNFYPYVLNNPINLRDPSGKSAGAVAIPVAEGVGGVICFGSGVCETVIVVGGVVVGVAATGYAIWHYFSKPRADTQSKSKPSPNGPKCDDKRRDQCLARYLAEQTFCLRYKGTELHSMCLARAQGRNGAMAL